MVKTMYHTQEGRLKRLTEAIICSRPDAWLGEGYYFWWYDLDATIWGRDSKKGTGRYEVYRADLDLSNVLNTSFYLASYETWVEILCEIARTISARTGHKASK